MMSKLLFIDDEESVRKVFSISLRKEGYEVLTAENGEKGLEVFMRETPPLALVDVRMPGMDGIEVLKRIKEINPETEVIIITGYGNMDSAIQALKLDASDFLTKPIKDEVLLIALKRAEEKLALKRKIGEYNHYLEDLVRERTRVLQRAYEQIKIFYEISRYVSENTSLKETIDFALKKIKEVVGYDYALPVIFNGKKDGFIAVEGYDSPSILGDWERIYSIASISEPWGTEHWKLKKLPLIKYLKRFPYVASIPIAREKDVMGSVISASYNSSSFSAQNMRFMYVMLSQASGVIRRIVLQDEQLKGLQDQIKRLSGFR